MANYIKSHSNYVLQQKHQDIKDGTIFERDITTIGGVDQFAPGHTPTYRSNNFIITVRNDGKPSNQHNSEKWQENESGTIWTLETISGMSASNDDENDTKIVLKQDYYDLNDFAYYGSLTELFRASVTDILKRFPGELYISSSQTNAYYTSAITVDFERIEERKQLGEANVTNYVHNPFGINIYSKVLPNDVDPLKYFANEGYKNYEISNSEQSSGISSWVVTPLSSKICPGKRIARVKLNDEIITIDVWVGDNNEIIYLSNKSGYHIRPKRELQFLDKFYNECDNFQKLLMNEDTHYKAVFSVIRENDYGYYRELVPFQFPIGEGGYNIDASDYGFNDYTQKMVEIGEFYDERFTDNLWRSMTHEAIKNFDWTYTREYNEGDEEEYVFGGQRIQKALRIFGREFDEALSYINNIRYINRVTYDERSNLPDYFLTDAVRDSGWDVKLIYPYSLTEETISGMVSDYSEESQLINYFEGNKIVRKFSQNAKTTLNPYTKESLGDLKNGYFIMCYDSRYCSGGTCEYLYIDGKQMGSGATYVQPCGVDAGKFVYRVAKEDEVILSGTNRIKSYTDESNWTFQRSNNEFLRRLKINSPYIWRTKGTIDGIEMILGMFGLKSERWTNEVKKHSCEATYEPDFSVTEYTSFTHRIEETWDAVHQDYRINWINSTKTTSYDNRFISNYNRYGLDNGRIQYQGIPVAYRDEYLSKGNDAYLSGYTRRDGSKILKRYLYPSFNSNEQLDGNPYYQMDGGWLSKIISSDVNKYNFQFDVDDNIVYSVYPSGETLYKESVRNIRRVDDINGLLSIPTSNLHNGVICYVTRIDKDAAMIGGVVYPVKKEWNGSGENKYVSLIKSDGFIRVGDNNFFDTDIIVYDKDGNPTMYDIEEKSDGYELKAYINDWDGWDADKKFICQQDEDGNYSISSFFLFKDWDREDKPYTNYFVLDDINYASEISVYSSEISGYTSGWRRLTEDDEEYIKINTIINYYEGNNPHNGNMVYDNGHEYFTYFNRIFKYAADNELFDTRCYDKDFYTYLDEEINLYGFSGLIESSETIVQYDKFLNEDSKIHFFGNYKAKKNGDSATTIDKIWIYGEDSERITSGFNYIYSGETSNINNYILSDSTGWLESYNPYSGQTLSGTVDEVTNQILNNKRFLIDFKLHNKWYTREGLEEIKYIDDIVMNYLTQMIPSSTILQIQYTSK